MPGLPLTCFSAKFSEVRVWEGEEGTQQALGENGVLTASVPLVWALQRGPSVYTALALRQARAGALVLSPAQVFVKYFLNK